MTRINLVDPSELTDQHLIAEYREMRLLAANIRRSFHTSGANRDKIPKQFTLNAGHVLFFKDKGQYIGDRYVDLYDEMRRRGFEPNHPCLDVDAWPTDWFGSWTPSERDKDIVRERIALRISQRPGWYRKNGQLLETQQCA